MTAPATGAARPKAIVYIDGFNLYYNALRKTPYRWFDIQSALEALFPEYDIDVVKYFTARVSDHKGDGANLRQQVYLRALKTLPKVQIVFGNFLKSHPTMPTYPLTTPPTFVQVLKTEEKGSDVNIACHMLCDGFEGNFDVAILVSNDSDLKLAVDIVKNKLQKDVAIVTKGPANKSLVKTAGFHRELRLHYLRNHQLPSPMTDTSGQFTAPHGWKKEP